MINLDEIKERDDLELQDIPAGLFGYDIRIIQIGEEDLLFHAKDCATILEYKDTSQSIRKHVPIDQKVKIKLKNLKPVDSTGFKLSKPGDYFITEEGLYYLIAGSKMQKAEDFKAWVFGEVLPTFRKTGKYSVDDFANSKHKKTIKQIPGFNEDNRFKRDCINEVQDLCKQKGEVSGVIWRKVIRVLNDWYGINVLREITKFTKRNKLDRRPNTREFLDAAGYKWQTYIAFEVLRHDEKLRTNPTYLTTLIALCNAYFNELQPNERELVKENMLKLFDKGIIHPAEDYAAIKSYAENKSGTIKTITFKE